MKYNHGDVHFLLSRATTLALSSETAYEKIFITFRTLEHSEFGMLYSEIMRVPGELNSYIIQYCCINWV